VSSLYVEFWYVDGDVDVEAVFGQTLRTQNFMKRGGGWSTGVERGFAEVALAKAMENYREFKLMMGNAMDKNGS